MDDVKLRGGCWLSQPVHSLTEQWWSLLPNLSALWVSQRTNQVIMSHLEFNHPNHLTIQFINCRTFQTKSCWLCFCQEFEQNVLKTFLDVSNSFQWDVSDRLLGCRQCRHNNNLITDPLPSNPIPLFLGSVLTIESGWALTDSTKEDGTKQML